MRVIHRLMITLALSGTILSGRVTSARAQEDPPDLKMLLNLDLYDDPGPIVPQAPNRFLVNRRQRPDQPFRLVDTSGAPKIVFVPVGDLQ